MCMQSADVEKWLKSAAQSLNAADEHTEGMHNFTVTEADVNVFKCLELVNTASDRSPDISSNTTWEQLEAIANAIQLALRPDSQEAFVAAATHLHLHAKLQGITVRCFPVVSFDVTLVAQILQCMHIEC